ncbi:MAG: hypothetical protein VX477_04120 [Actinomycetota bacterium]|nr:hypothetical protein [Actinomycetota bacterium]
MVPLLNAQEERELSQIIEAGAAARVREDAGKPVARSSVLSGPPTEPRTASSEPTCAWW